MFVHRVSKPYLLQHTRLTDVRNTRLFYVNCFLLVRLLSKVYIWILTVPRVSNNFLFHTPKTCIMRCLVDICHHCQWTMSWTFEILIILSIDAGCKHVCNGLLSDVCLLKFTSLSTVLHCQSRNRASSDLVG